MDNTPAVYIHGDNIEERELIEPVLRKFAQKTRKRITVSNPHGDVRDPYLGDDYDLCIFFWCVPVRTEESELDNVYGYATLPGQHDCFEFPAGYDEPSGTRITDSDGSDVALVVGKTLYVLFDLPHWGRGERNYADKMMECILNDVFFCRKGRAGFEVEMKKRLGKAEEHRFVRVCKKILDVPVEDIEGTEEELRRVKAEFLTALRRKKELRREKFSGQAVKYAPENLEKLYETLCKLSATGSIRVNYQTICVPIGQIDIEYDGTIYNIGKFEIWIDLLDEDSGVSCVNTTRVIDGYHHPHVNEDGEPCLGDLNCGVNRLLREGDLVSLVLVMGDILRSYNENGPFFSVDHWPVKRVLRPASEDED